MYLKKLSLLNFKNIAQQELVFRPGINCLVGDNGAGKTNVVDAVHLLSMCRSALQMTDSQSVRHGTDFYLVEGEYLTDAGRREQVVCSYTRRGGKVLKRNGKEYERLSDHVGLLPAVIVSPSDAALICDAADERRRYLNAFISQLDRPYLAALMRYNAVLAERNRLLKNRPDETVLEIYDRQMAEHGAVIHARRQEYAGRLRPLVGEFYRLLSGDREQVELIYRSELNDRPFDELLRAARQKDLANEFTTSGLHRDDLVLRIGGYPLRKYGSQGQQKSFLIALKLAQYVLVSEALGERPVLLLDDLFDKLDAGRVEQLLRLVSGERFGQIFITDCNPTRLRSILDRAGDDYALLTVADGAVAAAEEPGSAEEPAEETAAEEATTTKAAAEEPAAAPAEQDENTAQR
ncbi:DNA replication and repair protein RecF [uncultured Alistipes sp.]|uniref:DNA replication/repair protein RecF n=1 Tax=uncultured Alistipes sp. TaxID=538949 RepID=UPI00260D2647|nr:DNA replication and repair protein RecF [uncultured Alistipes sp.]